MHKTSTIFIVGKTVSGHKNRMNNRTAIDHLWEHYLAMGQFPFICFAYFVFITAEFHFAHIHNVVLATNEQVYLYTFFFIIASQSPSRLGGTDARNTNRGLSTPAVPVIFLSNCSCNIRLFFCKSSKNINSRKIKAYKTANPFVYLTIQTTNAVEVMSLYRSSGDRRDRSEIGGTVIDSFSRRSKTCPRDPLCGGALNCVIVHNG